MAATWNPILRYQAMQELDRRRKSELAYTTPLQKAPDMKEFLQHFYKQAYTSDKRQQYEQERIKYPQVDQIYEDLCLKEKIVSFEDFWQRYEYRCNFDRIVIELTQAASNDKNDNDDDSGFYDAVTSTVKKKKKKKTKQTAESSSSSNDHRPTSPDFASQLNNLWNSVTGIEPLSPSTNQNNSTTGTSPQNEIEPPTKFMNPAMAKLVDDKTVKDSTTGFSTPTANQMKEGKQQQVISPNDTPKASEPTPPREFATQVNSFWNSVISTSNSSSPSTKAPAPDAPPEVPSSNTGDVSAEPPSVNNKTTTKSSSIPSKTPDNTPMATPPITPTTEDSISKMLDTAGSALISKLSPTAVDHHKLASSPESALINRKTVDVSTIANEQLAQPVLLSKEEEEMKARTLLRIKAAEQAKALEDARKEVEKRKREQFEAKLQQQQEQQQAEAAKRKQQQEEKAAAAEEAKRARASKKSKKQQQRHAEHQFDESAPNDTDVINKDGDTAMDDVNIATTRSANDSPNNKTIEEDENEDKWTNMSYTDDEDSTDGDDDDENKSNENDVLQAAEARANAMKLLQDNSSNKEKNSEKTIQQRPKTELKEFGQHNISTSSSSQGGLSQADFLKEAVNKKKEGDPNMTTTPSFVVHTEMNALPATPKEEEIHTPPIAFSVPRGEFDKKKPHEDKTTIITNDTSTAQGEHLEDSLNNSSNGNNENEQQSRNSTVTSDKPANNLFAPPPGTLAAALGISVLKMDPKNHPPASNINLEGEKAPPIQPNNTNSSALANPACSETAAAPLQGTLAEALGLKIDQSPAASHIRQSGELAPPIQPYNKNSSALEYLATRGATTVQSSETLAAAISTSTHHTSTTEASTNSLDNKTERGLIYDTLRVVTVLAVLLSILVTHSPETIIDFIGI